MTAPHLQFLSVGADRRRIAYLQQRAGGSPPQRGGARGGEKTCDGNIGTDSALDIAPPPAHPGKEAAPRPDPKPGLIWLQGFKSEMVSTKAAALSQWAASNGRALLRFDYSGHGQSGGRFDDGTIGRWREETEAVFSSLTSGPQILIGSSMGGYLSLLLLRRLLVEQPTQAARIKALVLIAPAWNMTEYLWARMPQLAQRELLETGVWHRPSAYGAPYPITRHLIEDGRRHLVSKTPWNPGRPVSILHGRLDPDVPFTHSQTLCTLLDGGWHRLVEVPDGEHRLSRPEDIAKLFALIEAVS